MAKFMVKRSELKNVCKAVNDRKLAELKKEIIEILKNQDEKDFKKATDYLNSQEDHFTHLEKSLSGKWIEKAGYGIGTVRVWKGKKYKKIAPDKWVRVFDKEGRGTNIAIGKLIAKVQKIDNVEDLMAFVMANKQRFVDENGVDLPVLDKLRAAVDARNSGTMGTKEHTERETIAYNQAKNGLKKEKERLKEYEEQGADESELKKIRDNISDYEEKISRIEKERAEKKPAEKKKSFKQEMNQLYDAQDEAWEGFESGSDIKSSPENSKKFYERVKKFVDDNNIKLSQKHYDELEDKNGHSFNEALALAGAYGEDAKKKELARNKEYSQKYKGQILDLSMIDEFKTEESDSDRLKRKAEDNYGDWSKKELESELKNLKEKEKDGFNVSDDREQINYILETKEFDEDTKTYWIQDNRGNRLTNEDAKKKIIGQMKYLAELEDMAGKKLNNRTANDIRYYIDYLKDRLNPEDRKEIELEAEKHQNRSDAMKMSKDELKKYVMDKANEYYKNNQDALTKKANEAVEKMTAAECNKETQLTDKNSLGMFVDKFDADGKTPTDEELQELAYNVVLSRVAAAQWGDKNRKELAEQNEAETKQKEEAIIQKENEIKEKYNGYFDNRKGLDRARDLKSLEKKYKYDGKVLSNKEFVEQAMDNGAEIKEHEVNKIDYPSRTRWNRMNGYEQEQWERKIKEAGKKTVYTINGYEFPKNVVDYAKYYKENVKAKSGSETPAKSEIAIKNKATSLAGAFGYSKDYAMKMGSPFNLELAEQTVDEELDWDESSKKALKEELKRIYSEKKVQKSLFDDFIIDNFIDEEINDEEEEIEERSLWNDYSAEEPDDFNSTELQVREAMNRHFGNCL